MRLTYRPMSPTDGERCLNLLHEGDGFAYDETTRQRLPELWRNLLRGGAAGESAVVEDVDRTDARGIVGFGISVFVTDGFADAARTGQTPYLAGRLATRMLAGDWEHVLTPRAVARANGGDGLNLLVLHRGVVREEFDDAEIMRVRAKIVESFFAVHTGYRIKQVLIETADPVEKDLVLNSGSRLITDYADFWRACPDAAPPPNGRRPYLLGLTRDQIGEGCRLAPLFLYDDPCFFFRPSEQAVLRAALRDQTDEEIARALDVTLWTVRKRWKAIYERVEAADAALLAASPLAGSEKKRRLLRYLRDHAEELRPCEQQRRRCGGGVAAAGAQVQ